MGIFVNSATNRVYLHGAIQAFAEAGGGIFLFVLLLKAGVSPPLILCSIAAINVLRFVLRAGVLSLARRIGLRNTLIIGTLLEANSYWLVPWVNGPGAMLIVFVCISSVGSVIYWTSYHAYVAVCGDAENRGGQVGFIEAINALVSLIAPAVVSLLLIGTGPIIAFAAVAVVQMLSAVPLIGAPSMPVPQTAPIDAKTRWFAFRLFFADGWAVACVHYLWQISLFLALGQHFGSYGGTMVLAGLFGAIMSVVIGRRIDLGHGKGAVALAYGLAAIVATLKALGYATPWLAILATALAAIAAAIQIPVIMARVYNLAQQSACPLRFHMVTEAGWDMGSAAGCLTAAMLLVLGAPWGVAIALALLGLAAVFGLLRSSYANQASG